MTSYTAQLQESGLFELHEKVTLKLKVIEQLDGISRIGNIDVNDELRAVIDSLLLDLSIVVLKEDDHG